MAYSSARTVMSHVRSTDVYTYVGVQGKKEDDACTEETEITRGRKGRVTARGEGARGGHVGKGKEHFGRGSGNVLIARTKAWN